MTEPRYPEARANVSQANGNPFTIMKVVTEALMYAGVSLEEVKQYGEESVAADFDDVAKVASRWVTTQ
jgi:hypothetical protein